MAIYNSVQEYIDKKIVKQGEHWVWQGCTLLSSKYAKEIGEYYAHRLVFNTVHGRKPRSLLKQCEVDKCVNPNCWKEVESPFRGEAKKVYRQRGSRISSKDFWLADSFGLIDWTNGQPRFKGKILRVV